MSSTFSFAIASLWWRVFFLFCSSVSWSHCEAHVGKRVLCTLLNMLLETSMLQFICSKVGAHSTSYSWFTVCVKVCIAREITTNLGGVYYYFSRIVCILYAHFSQSMNWVTRLCSVCTQHSCTLFFSFVFAFPPYLYQSFRLLSCDAQTIKSSLKSFFGCMILDLMYGSLSRENLLSTRICFAYNFKPPGRKKWIQMKRNPTHIEREK